MANFSADIARFARDTNRSLEQASRVFKISLFSGVVQSTRVDTGRLRGGWQCSHEPATVDIERLSPSGAEPIQDIQSSVQSIGIDYLTNNVAYAQIWNERDGIIDSNLARMERTLQEAIRDSTS